MIFLCAHETEGFALCEAMSSNVPIFAWDPGFCQDTARFEWNDPVIKTTSIPYFDKRCGMSFLNADEFMNKITTFWGKVQKGSFNPREYILESLTLKISAEKMMKIIADVYQ